MANPGSVTDCYSMSFQRNCHYSPSKYITLTSFKNCDRFPKYTFTTKHRSIFHYHVPQHVSTHVWTRHPRMGAKKIKMVPAHYQVLDPFNVSFYLHNLLLSNTIWFPPREQLYWQNDGVPSVAQLSCDLEVKRHSMFAFLMLLPLDTHLHVSHSNRPLWLLVHLYLSIFLAARLHSFTRMTVLK